MLEACHRPELITAALTAYLLPIAARRDGEGEGQRRGRKLVEGGPLPQPLLTVAEAVCPGLSWGLVTLQCYDDGRAHTSCHSDLGVAGFGFILSLGATRSLRVHRVPSGTRPQDGCGDPSLDARTIRCEHGTVVIMSEEFHEGWHHQVPPEPEATGQRLALVFWARPKRR